MLLPLLLNNMMGEGGEGEPEAAEHGFVNHKLQPYAGGFTHRMGGFVHPWGGMLIPPVKRAGRAAELSDTVEWRWPVDREWFSRMESKLDGIASDQADMRVELAEVRKDVSYLKQQNRWKSMLLVAIGGLFAALVTIFSGCAYPQQVSTVKDATPQPEDSVRLLVDCVYPDFPEDTRAGSGIAVGPKHIATAYHVVDCDRDKYDMFGNLVGVSDGNAMKITVIDSLGRHFEGVEHAFLSDGKAYHDVDAAIVMLTGVQEPFTRWVLPAESNPLPGDDVCVLVPFPSQEKRCGKVRTAWTLYYDEWQNWMKPGNPNYSSPSFIGVRGNSGSGVLNSQGQLVGLLVAGLDEDKDGDTDFAGIINISGFRSLFDKVTYEQDFEFSTVRLAE